MPKHHSPPLFGQNHDKIIPHPNNVYPLQFIIMEKMATHRENHNMELCKIILQ